MNKKYKVLIVEDEMLVRIGMHSLVDWDSLGFAIIGDAENGQKALEYFSNRETAPDIVFTDINMPLLDGLQMMQEVRDVGYRNCIFVVLTVLEDFEYVRRALQLGAFDYIPKFDMSAANVEEILRKARVKLEQTEEQYVEKERSTAESALTLARLMQGFLQFRLYSAQELENLLRPFGIKREGMRFLCGAVRVRDADLGGVQDGNSLADVALLNLLNDMVGALGKGGVYIGEDNVYYLILFCEEQEISPVKRKIKETCNIIQMYFNCRMQVGLSSWGLQFGDLFLLHEQSKAALAVNICWNLAECLIYGENIREKLISNFRRELQKIRTESEGIKWDETTEKETFEWDVEEQKRLLIRLENDQVQKILAGQEIRLEPAEQAELFAAVGSAKTGTQITELFRRKTEEFIRRRQQERTGSFELRRALDYIHVHYRENITAEQIARYAGYSAGYLSRQMKEQNGKSIMEYLNWFRIEEAKKLILEEGLKSYEISERVGFADPNYFSRIFKKYTGMSANEYRRKTGRR